jgi:hypothetical protein
MCLHFNDFRNDETYMKNYFLRLSPVLLSLFVGITCFEFDLCAEGQQSEWPQQKAKPAPMGKNLNAGPPIRGKIRYQGVEGSMEWVPPLIGKDPTDPKVRAEFLDGTGYSVKVVGYQKSSTIPKGAIIKQTPKEWEEVKTPGEIKVIVSSGN